MDRAQLAAVLPRRRSVPQPEDVGLDEGQRRRTSGLRREEDQGHFARFFVGSLRAVTARGPDPEADELVTELNRRSPECRGLWEEHEVVVHASLRKRVIHPTVGTVTLDCQTPVAENQAQSLLVYTATPGTEDYTKLELLSIVGGQRFGALGTGGAGA